MIEWFNEHFAPGAMFLWLCVLFVLMIPLSWLRASKRRDFSSKRSCGSSQCSVT